jgi:LPXTG-site transpeptidase (sortase) family protein
VLITIKNDVFTRGKTLMNTKNCEIIDGYQKNSMDKPKNDNIFPEDMFPKRNSQQPPCKKNEQKYLSNESVTSHHSVSEIHIPYKKEACRLSRKVHLTEEVYELHIPEPKTPETKILTTQTISNVAICQTEKRKPTAPLAALQTEGIPQKQNKRPETASVKNIPILRMQKKTSVQSSHFISVSKTDEKKSTKVTSAGIFVPKVQKKKETLHIPVAKGMPAKNGMIHVQIQTTSSEEIIADHIKGFRRQLLQLAKEKTQEAVPKEPKKKIRKKYPSFFRFRFEKKKKERKEKKGGMLGEIIRFGTTTAAIFVLSFSVMNASALSELFSAKLNPMAAAEKQIALEKVVGNKHVPILPTAGMKHENHKSFPSLDIKIGPLENRIVIPKIGKNVPIVGVPTDALQKGDWTRLENDIQTALKDGVVHYPGTAQPGQIGNVFITGHSSYYLWDPGKYKDVFVRLHDMDVGDEFTVFWNQNTYHYRIRERKVVAPEETSVLSQPQHERIATLMTCTPIGTAKNRLVLVADQI